MNPNNDTIDWINSPHSLVGERIHVAWKGGKRYGGKVTKYSASSKIYTILYDDGDEKYYDLYDKTFRIEGESSDWTPTTSRPLRDARASLGASAPSSGFTSAQNPLHRAGGASHTTSSSPTSNIYGNTGYGNNYNYQHHHAPARYRPRERAQYTSK